jgi:hypothetical protein
MSVPMLVSGMPTQLDFGFFCVASRKLAHTSKNVTTQTVVSLFFGFPCAAGLAR